MYQIAHHSAGDPRKPDDVLQSTTEIVVSPIHSNRNAHEYHCNTTVRFQLFFGPIRTVPRSLRSCFAETLTLLLIMSKIAVLAAIVVGEINVGDILMGTEAIH